MESFAPAAEWMGTVRLWDVRSRACVTTLRETPGAVYQIALSADESLLVSGELDRKVRLRELRSRRYTSTLQADTGAAYGVSLSAAGTLMASCGIDGIVSVWQVQGELA
jgi:WD40 repeat protein